MTNISKQPKKQQENIVDQHMEESIPENHHVIRQKEKDQDIEQWLTHDQQPPLQEGTQEIR